MFYFSSDTDAREVAVYLGAVCFGDKSALFVGVFGWFVTRKLDTICECIRNPTSIKECVDGTSSFSFPFNVLSFIRVRIWRSTNIPPFNWTVYDMGLYLEIQHRVDLGQTGRHYIGWVFWSKPISDSEQCVWTWWYTLRDSLVPCNSLVKQIEHPKVILF